MTEWHLTIDCIDPAPLVPFWAEVLGYAVQPPPDGFATWNDWYLSVGVPAEELDRTSDGADRLYDPTGRGPKIWFQPVPEAKVVKNRLHLDVYVTGGRSTPLAERRGLVDTRVAELLAIGGSIDHVDTGDDHYHVTMRDPAGNEFCVA
jgi:hypothetical protein